MPFSGVSKMAKRPPGSLPIWPCQLLRGLKSILPGLRLRTPRGWDWVMGILQAKKYRQAAVEGFGADQAGGAGQSISLG
ncbi:hypothetical protein D3C81_2155620 [compost metagenome]